MPAGGGYLFVTFRGEATPLTEQIYLGLSEDSVRWEALKGGHPALVSDVGEKGVRDPYLLRAHGGGKFFIVATDLSINLNKDWKRATHAGSRSIVVWESADLVKWSAPRLVKVAADDAGCTWAPEAIYDEETRDYLVYWASTTARDHFAKQRIWSAHTADFRTFSPAEIYIDKASTVFDTDIVRDGDRYYRFSKDESAKDITMEVAEKLSGPWTGVPGFSAPGSKSSEGPAAFKLRAEPGAPAGGPSWCLLLDHPSRTRGYQAFITADLSSGRFAPSAATGFPFVFRHGSVLPLSAEEYQRVRSGYAGAEGSK